MEPGHNAIGTSHKGSITASFLGLVLDILDNLKKRAGHSTSFLFFIFLLVRNSPFVQEEMFPHFEKQ